ncbi:GNAT family N-acetyltransferase [Paenibacillus sp. UMB4589-SE434]|uniref:GNAT family N-acetyltransferase n=1 Tax=Paenibacillus sp. UMB4589-SE434 TaxID=3046314 RepID=UPI00254EB1D6|nr:GNAT family N-acetyltransferase [Paenibacillus sp. UMB4589-SE434]MDK8179279.1 GNAT family N-acetyltransferase [Paenibacillus sp. UMB4589-SE434]
MQRLLQFPKEQCPFQYRNQIVELMRQEWPAAFDGRDDHMEWVHQVDTNPTSFLLTEDDIVISYLAVPWKQVIHKGERYKAYALSEVVTNPAYRNQGYGLRLIREAMSFIHSSQADISIFTCKPELIDFYTQGGWNFIKGTHLIGGTRHKPFRSDVLGLSTMISIISDKARRNQLDFTNADIYLELGEQLLW